VYIYAERHIHYDFDNAACSYLPHNVLHSSIFTIMTEISSHSMSSLEGPGSYHMSEA